MQLLKKPDVLSQMALSNTTLYAHIKEGLMTPPVPLGNNSVAWPDYEVSAVNAARVAGKADDDVKVIVTRLVSLRPRLSAKTDDQVRAEIEQIMGEA